MSGGIAIVVQLFAFVVLRLVARDPRNAIAGWGLGALLRMVDARGVRTVRRESALAVSGRGARQSRDVFLSLDARRTTRAERQVMKTAARSPSSLALVRRRSRPTRARRATPPSRTATAARRAAARSARRREAAGRRRRHHHAAHHGQPPPRAAVSSNGRSSRARWSCRTGRRSASAPLTHRPLADEARRDDARLGAALLPSCSSRRARRRTRSTRTRSGARKASRQGSRRMVLYIRDKVILANVGPHGIRVRAGDADVLLHDPVREPARPHPVRVDGDGQHRRDGDARGDRVRRHRGRGHARARLALHQHDLLLEQGSADCRSGSSCS